MQTALVTGATSGIGRAIAIALKAAGYRVLAMGRNAAALEDLAQQGLIPLAADLSDRAATLAALQGYAVDVLIANAGTMPKPGAFDQQSLDEIDRTLLVNLSSVLWLVHAVLPGMRVKGAGHIVLTGSSAAHAPGANFAAYAASKAALSAFAVGLRGDLAGSGLRVTEIAPGRVETALYESVLPDAARASMYQGGHALQPGDVAEAVLAVLRLPPHATVTRLDLMPTFPQPAMPLK